MALWSERGDPLLASWQYGLGRVAAWSADAGPTWSSEWLAWPRFGQFWSQVVRWTLAPPEQGDLRVLVRQQGHVDLTPPAPLPFEGRGEPAQAAAALLPPATLCSRRSRSLDGGVVRVEALREDGSFLDRAPTEARIRPPSQARGTTLARLPLTQVAPGRYEGSFLAREPGVYGVEVAQELPGGGERRELAGVTVPADPEHAHAGANTALLGRLTHETGGRLLQEARQVFARDDTVRAAAAGERWDSLAPLRPRSRCSCSRSTWRRGACACLAAKRAPAWPVEWPAPHASKEAITMSFCLRKPSRPRQVGHAHAAGALTAIALATLLAACGSPSAPAAQPAAPASQPAPSGSQPVGEWRASRGGQPAAATGAVTINLSFPSRSAPQVLPIIAQEEGFLPRQGIELESTFFQGGPPALQAMMAGAAEITSQITGTTINAIANGADIAIVMGLQADPDYQLYARAEFPTVQALDGKKVAAADPGSELNTLVRKTLAFYGLPADRYDLLPIGATNNRYTALTQGAVDATLLSVPLTFDAEARGMKYLGTTGDAVPSYMFTTIAAKRDWSRQNADALVRFIRGYQEFLVWMQDPANRGKMVDHWVKLSGASEEAARQTYDT